MLDYIRNSRVQAGEAGGIMISESRVKRVDLARIGFGQSIAVTPIQLITACCAAVNGGKLMQPYVVKEIVSVILPSPLSILNERSRRSLKFSNIFLYFLC